MTQKYTNDMIDTINYILDIHKVCGAAYIDTDDNFIINYNGIMRNSGAMRFLRDLLAFSDLVNDNTLNKLNEFSKRYAVSKKDKENGFIL